MHIPAHTTHPLATLVGEYLANNLAVAMAVIFLLPEINESKDSFANELTWVSSNQLCRNNTSSTSDPDAHAERLLHHYFLAWLDFWKFPVYDESASCPVYHGKTLLETEEHLVLRQISNSSRIPQTTLK